VQEFTDLSISSKEVVGTSKFPDSPTTIFLFSIDRLRIDNSKAPLMTKFEYSSRCASMNGYSKSFAAGNEDCKTQKNIMCTERIKITTPSTTPKVTTAKPTTTVTPSKLQTATDYKVVPSDGRDIIGCKWYCPSASTSNRHIVVVVSYKVLCPTSHYVLDMIRTQASKLYDELRIHRGEL